MTWFKSGAKLQGGQRGPSVEGPSIGCAKVLCKSDQLFVSTKLSIYRMNSRSIYHAKLSVLVFMSLK